MVLAACRTSRSPNPPSVSAVLVAGVGVAKRGIANDIPDDLLEDQFDVEAHVGAQRLLTCVQCGAKFPETICETVQRTGNSSLIGCGSMAMPLERALRSVQWPEPTRRRAQRR